MRNTRRAIAVGAVALIAAPAAEADGTLRVTIDGRPAALAGTATSVARIGDSTVSGRTVTLGLRSPSGSSAVHGAVGEGLRVTAGGRSVRLTNLRLDGVGTRNVRVSARLDGKARRTLFAVSAATTRTDAASGARTIAATPLRVTSAGARSLRYRLGRTVDAQRIGRIALTEVAAATPNVPTPVPAPLPVVPPTPLPVTTTPVDPPAPEPEPEPLPVVRAIEEATVAWPFSSWIVNVFSCSYPGIVCPFATDGATVTSTGEGADLLRTFHFSRRADGAYDTETGKATVELAGLIRVGYIAPGHAIATYISNPTIEIDGDSAVLSAPSAASAPPATVWYPPSGNSSVDPLDGPGANAWIPETLVDRPIATLDLSTDGEDAAVKTVSEDGKTITWSNVPATATPEAAAIGHGVIVDGYAYDRLTLTVKVADRAPVVD